jgi:hypothetical protein
MLLEYDSFAQLYGEHLREPTYTGHLTVFELPESLCRTESPVKIKDLFMHAFELYVGGQFPSRGFTGNPREQMKRRQQILTTVLDLGRTLVRDFYQGLPFDAQKTWAELYPIFFEFGIYSLGGTGFRNRFLNNHTSRVLQFGHNIQRDPRVRECDHVVLITNGGLEPALLAAECLGISGITPIAFSQYHYEDCDVCLPFWHFDQDILPEIRDRSILLVDDAVHGGKTFDRVEEFLDKFDPRDIHRRYVVQG